MHITALCPMQGWYLQRLCAVAPVAPIKRRSNPKLKRLSNHYPFLVSCREKIFDAHSSTADAAVCPPAICIEHQKRSGRLLIKVALG
jgi:hypothetical protein